MRFEGREFWRPRIVRAQLIAFCLLPFLGGCLPGSWWGGGGSDDESDRASFSESKEDAPTLNRSYKTNLAAKVPSTGETAQDAPPAAESSPEVASFGAMTVDTRTPSRIAPALLPPAQALQNFYGALADLSAGKRSAPVSILHLGGDQLIDDKFASSLREHFISRFGNAGRGVMTPGLYAIRGMKIDRGGEWSLKSAAANAQGPFGIMGVRVDSAAGNAWLRFTSVEGFFDWAEVTLLTGPENGTAAISVDGDVKLVPTRSSTTAQTSIRVTAKAREIMIRPKGDGVISVLAVTSGTNSPGVFYSNAGLPGATAATIGKWDEGFATADFRKLNPDLIIFEYGIREGFDDALDVSQYQANLKLAFDRVKSLAPNASILVVGPQDAARLPVFASSAGAHACRALSAQESAGYAQMMARSDTRLARWHAPPRLEPVRLALKRQAAERGAFFWDWARYMGGPCSIHAWTSLKPPLAAQDHVTLTEAGDERSARAVFSELMAGYEAYQAASKARGAVAASFTAVVEPTKGKKRN